MARPTGTPKAAGLLAALSAFVSFALAMLVFIALPTWVAGLFKKFVSNHLALNLIEGCVRLGIMLGYIKAISYMHYIRRVFQYHGAEHKVVHAVEQGRPLLPQHTYDLSTVHPRCGTNFLFLVIVVKVVLFSLLSWGPLWHRIVWRLLLLPVVAGVSYELLRLGAKPQFAWMTKLLLLPGLWAQKYLTTHEPTDDQVEVAIKAMEAVLRRERENATEPQETVYSAASTGQLM